MSKDKKYTTQQLAQMVKAKYPEYTDMDDEVLVQKIIKKYPEYSQYLIEEKEEPSVDLKKKEDTDLSLDPGSSEQPQPKKLESKEDEFQYKDLLTPLIGGFSTIIPGFATADYEKAWETGRAQGMTAKEFIAGLYTGDVKNIDDAKKLTDAAKLLEAVGPSEDYKKFTKKADELKEDYGDFLGTIVALSQNPEVIPETIVSSLVAMPSAVAADPISFLKSITAGAATGFAVGKGGPIGSLASSIIGGAAAGARFSTSYMLDTSLSLLDFMKDDLSERGLEFSAENIYNLTQDQERLEKVKTRAERRGYSVGLVEAIFGKLSSGFKGIKQPLIEAGGGTMGELTAQATSGQEINIREGILEGVSGVQGVLLSTLESKAKYSLSGEKVSRDKIKKVIEESTPEEAANLKVSIENDNELSNLYSDKVKRNSIEKDLPDGIPEENREQIVNLELERKKLEGKKTFSAKKRVQEIESLITDLSAPKDPAETTSVEADNTEVSETQQETEIELFNDDGSAFVVPEGFTSFELGSKKQTIAIVDKNGKLLASFDSKTRKRRKTNTLAEKELIKEYDYTKGKKAIEVDPEGAKNPNLELDEFIADKSENAQEVAQALQRESKVDTSQKVDPIFEFIEGTKINPSFFKRVLSKGVRKETSKTIQLSWFRKNGVNVDDVIKEINEKFNVQYDEDNIKDIILDNPSNRVRKKTTTYDDLLFKFKELTGFSGSKATIDAVANQDPSQLKSDVPQEVVEEQGRQREIAEKTIEKEDLATEPETTQEELFDDSEKPESIEVLETHMDAADKKLEKSSILQRAKDFAKKIPQVLKREIIDRQSDVKSFLSKLSGKAAVRALNLLITKAGSGALASQIFKGFESKIYKGLKSLEVATLDSIIYARRIISINENRRQKRAQAAEYEVQYGRRITPEQAKNIDNSILDFYYEKNEETGVYQIRDFNPYKITTEGKVMDESVANQALEQIKQKLGEEQYNKLFQRSEVYFDSTKSLLQRLFDSGRITKSEFNYFKDINYSPLRVIEKIFPESGKDLSSLTEKEQADFLRLNGIPAKDIIALKDGGEYTVMKDSRQLLAMYTAAVTKRSFNNRFMNAFFDAFVKNSQNKTIQEHMTIDPKVAAKKGFVPMGFFKDGKKTLFYVDETTAKQIRDLRSEKPLLNFLGTISGAKLIRFFATGANPFFIISNVPMDFVNVAFFTDAYNKGIEQFKPIAMFKLARDFSLNLAGKIKSDLTGSGRFKEALEEAIEHGMGFDFLSQEGKSKRVGSKKIASKLIDFLSYTGVASEQAMRLSVYLKVKKDKIADFVKENGAEPTGQDLEDIKFASAAEARETIDFNQGGSLVKDLDKVAPYLNATVQGFRRPFKYYSENRFGFISNAIQATFMASAVPLANSLIAELLFKDEEEKEEALRKLREETSPYEKTNYFLFIDPRNPKNEDGDINYIRIRKLPTIAPITYLGEEIIYSYRDGKEFSFDDFSKTIEAAIPVSGSLIENIGYNPGVSAYAALAKNYDLYRQQEIFRKNDNALINKTAEGLYDEDVATLYKYFGFGGLDVVSPKRMQVAVEKFITSPSTNPLVGAGYAGVEIISNLNKEGADVEPIKEGFKTFFEEIAKSSKRRMFRTTNPRVKYFSQIDKLQEKLKDINTEIYLKESKLKQLIRDYKEETKIEDRESRVLPEKIMTFINENFDSSDKLRMRKKALRKIQLPSVSSIYFDLIFAKNTKSQAEIMRAIYGESIDKEERAELNKLSYLIQGRRISSSAFREYYKMINEGD